LVGLLWTSDGPVAKASTYIGQHNAERRGQISMPKRDSKPRSQRPKYQDLGLRPRGH
jgi:hypothetical protein